MFPASKTRRLRLISPALTDTDGSEELSITISGVPDGAVLSAGTHNADGSWTLTPAQLTGLTVTPPQDYSGTMNLSVTATSLDGTSTAASTASFSVTVGDVPDAVAPTLTVGPATGNEDTAITLNIAVDPADAGTTITIAGVPDGATLSAGTDNLLPNADGTYTLTAAQLDGLT